jgi:hypothetical protein
MLVGAYEINSVMGNRSNKLVGLKAKDQALNQEQLQLSNAKKEVAKYSDLQKITQTIVPEDKDQAEAVREIVNIAGANGISLASVTFPASTLGGTSAGSAAAGSSSGAGASSAYVAPNPNAGKLSQLQPVKNIPGVYDLQITVQSDANNPVSYPSFIGFLSDLEHNRRTAQISSINLQPTTKNPNLLTFTLILNEYIKP